MQSLLEWWDGVMSIQGARWIIYPTLLAVLILCCYYFLNLFRNLAVGGGDSSGDFDYLGEFRRMRDQGHLDQDEYKKLTGLVPLPNTETGNAVVDVADGGAEALTAAAKEAIRRAAEKRQLDEENEPGSTDAQESIQAEQAIDSEEADPGNGDGDEHSAE